MELKFLDNCRADGRAFVIGEVADLPDHIARELVLLQRAEPVDPAVTVKPPMTTSPEPEPAPEPAPDPEPKPAPRRRARPTPSEE